ncbi:sensor histidine kinase [Paenibacillus spongiae]|uniref:histidine kinase n=1 Tax=Paenibacillus spongiae TaxID=2909671 RepID=A0ABY5S1N6_9BACL|nr:ATP-binding protein [Paenibacillus spongiae]UVI27789.1 ATP-binding protein [Paenibacillus spongiae]
MSGSSSTTKIRFPCIVYPPHESWQPDLCLGRRYSSSVIISNVWRYDQSTFYIIEEGRTIRRLFLIIIVLTAAQLLLSGCSSKADTSAPEAKQGVLDLRSWSFQNDGKVKLQGQWAFYSQKLLEPQDLERSGIPLYMNVPKTWNSYPSSVGMKKGQGVATYRLTVLITPDDQMLSLRVPNIFSAYKLWINGKLLTSAGQVGTSREHSKAEQYPRIVTFNGQTEKLDIVVQVSNFQHRKGGIWVNFTLGDSGDIIKSQMKRTIQEMIIFGSLMIIGIYHIGLYAFRRKEQFTLHFGLLCLFVAARSSVTSGSFLMQMFTSLTWENGMKIEYISFALSAVSGYLYINGLFPKDTSLFVKRIVVSFGTALCLVVLVTPAIQYTRLLPVFQLFVLFVSLYTLLVLILALLRKREGACFVLAGVAVFVGTILNDMLFYNEWFARNQLVPLGLFFFILMQSFIISTRFSSALRRVEQVSDELRELNVHLEERIEERTDTLRCTNEALERTNRELARSEMSRRHLMANISHDLRTPITLLQGYLEAMQDGVVKTEEQQQKYIRMMLGKVGGLNRLIGNLFELTKLEAGQLRFEFAEVTLAEWMNQLCEHYELDVRSRGIVFACGYIPTHDQEGEPLPPSRIMLHIDQQRMDQVLANLIYNAIKYTPEKGRIALSFQFEPTSNRAIVKVEDTGYGIESEHLPFIFDRFYKKDKARNSAEGGSGLGLAIAKEIVEAHSGTIGAESEVGQGTIITFTLPAVVT